MFFSAEQAKYGKPDKNKMCGEGCIEKLDHAPESPYMRAKYVEFKDGAQTKWHYHTGEQLLLGTEGTGFVEFKGLSGVTLRQGNRIIIPAGVWHRHGAKKEKNFIHLTVTTGKTIWDEDDSCDERSVEIKKGQNEESKNNSE